MLHFHSLFCEAYKTLTHILDINMIITINPLQKIEI